MTAILPKELLTATLGGLSLLVVSGGSDGDVLVQQSDGTYAPETLVTGDVFGPASSTDNAIARFDATTGKLLQNCVVTIGDTGNIAGLGTVSCGAITASGAATLPALLFDGRWSSDPTKRVVQIRVDSSGNGEWSLNRSANTNGMVWASASGGFVQVQRDGGFYFSDTANQATGASASVTLTRQSAGVLQIGTTAANAAGSVLLTNLTASGAITCGAITASGLVCMSIYTVATLPSASANAYKEANVSDALAPAMGVAVVGGGSVKTKVRSNGTDWTVCGI